LTLQGIIIGFLLGLLIGTIAGIGIVYSVMVKRIVWPLAIALRVSPMVAIAPIIVIWVGYGLPAKIVIAMIVTLFPIIVNTSTGLLTPEPEFVQLMKSMKATKLQIFLKLRLPAAMPTYFAGLKIAIGGALIGTIIAEVVAPTDGIGFLVVLAISFYDVAYVFANVIVLFALGLGLFVAVTLAEKFIVRWKQEEIS
jgi:NitT/TauT family transport system permease protein